MVENHRWSTAMGCNPDQIPEMMKRFPGSEYNADGDLLVRSRHDKLKKMKERGLCECDGFRHRDGVRTKNRRRN